ncbi:MAG: Lipase precursor [Labilithrix sp.]|nr:Lipase precursor [Labilithrix sp.]
MNVAARALSLAVVTASLALGTLAAGCSAEAPDEAAAATDDAFTVKASRHAIVLAHGFDGSRTNRWSFYRVADALRKDGHVVHEAQVSPYRSVPERAVQLAAHIDAAREECRAHPGCDPAQVHVIAHSMGGLDARYVIGKLGYGDRVASLTTVSTPHHGSHIADVLLGVVSDDMNKAVSAIASAWATTYTSKDLAGNSDLKGALRSISEDYTARTFNPEVKDDPRVTYLSWAGVSNVAGVPNTKDQIACEGTLSSRLGIRDAMDLSLVPAAAFVAHGTALLPNDGMVTVESAKWGIFKGCIPADHLDEVGQPKDRAHVLTGFDHLVFYRKIASSLDGEVSSHGSAGQR